MSGVVKVCATAEQRTYCEQCQYIEMIQIEDANVVPKTSKLIFVPNVYH